MPLAEQYSGSVLVPNTLVCEVSRLFLDPNSEEANNGISSFRTHQRHTKELNVKRFKDLCSLIEALCLYENLYTLPCSLPSDASSLSLRTKLIDSGVLKVLDTSEVHSDISKAIVGELRQASGTSQPNVDDRSDQHRKFSDSTADSLNDFFSIRKRGSTTEDKMRTLTRRGSRDRDQITDPNALYIVSGRSNEALNASSERQLAESITWSMNYRYSGAYESCTSILRDMYYIRVAESESVLLPYWPQLDRIEFSKKYPGFIDKDTRTKLYQKLSDGLNVSLAEIETAFVPGAVFIPPFSAIAMGRSSNPTQLLESIFAVREEFQGLRKQLSALEHERMHKTKWKDKTRLSEQQKTLLREAAKAFESQRIISLEALVRYAPEVMKPVMTPTDPTKYSASLVLQPVEWLIQWWQRRPISKLLQVANQVGEVDKYNLLATQVFGQNWPEKID